MSYRRPVVLTLAIILCILFVLLWLSEPSVVSLPLGAKVGAETLPHHAPSEVQRRSLGTSSHRAQPGSSTTQGSSYGARVQLDAQIAVPDSQLGITDTHDFTVTLPLVSSGYQVTFEYYGSIPPGFLDYNDQDYAVYDSSLCGRPVVIAWERAANIQPTVMAEVSAFYFTTFESWCELFGHFPYASYTVVLEREPEHAGGETGIGYEGVVWNYIERYEQRIAHEVFHGWVGGFLIDAEETKYDDGLWFREGITQYYGDRGAGESRYLLLMEAHLRNYLESIVGTKYDIPLTDMPETALDTGDSQYRLNVYWKGALVAYMMDKALIARGLNLDMFLRQMYNTYGWTRSSFVTGEAMQALEELSRSDWSDFFDRYIYGGELLPVDGSFTLLPR